MFNCRNRILSIEPNATLEKELRFLKRIVRGFDCHRGGLHDWLGDRMGRPKFEVREVTAEVFPLHDLDLSPAFIKIDVERSELPVLRGLAGALERCRPILLDERSGDFDAIQHLLKASGHSAYDHQADVGRFVPFASHGPVRTCSSCVPTRSPRRRRAIEGPSGRGRFRDVGVAQNDKSPAMRGLRSMRRRGLEPPPGYPGPGPQPGNSGVISIRCVPYRPYRPDVRTIRTHRTIWMLPRMLPRAARLRMKARGAASPAASPRMH
jgi:Methyltransferase FkbM domain